MTRKRRPDHIRDKFIKRTEQISNCRTTKRAAISVIEELPIQFLEGGEIIKLSKNDWLKDEDNILLSFTISNNEIEHILDINFSDRMMTCFVQHGEKSMLHEWSYDGLFVDRFGRKLDVNLDDLWKHLPMDFWKIVEGYVALRGNSQ